MIIKLKLFALLSDYLPAGAQRHTAELTIDKNSTVQDVIDQIKLPAELTHLVLVNGVYIAPEQRPSQHFSENDVLAIWPPVAGG